MLCWHDSVWLEFLSLHPKSKGLEVAKCITQSELKHPENMPGKYWVACDSCSRFGICVDTAPNNFRFPLVQDGEKSSKWNGAYVFKQPVTEDEEANCRLAMQLCPVDAIHDNGRVSGKVVV